MANEAEQRFAALKEATLALSAMCGEARPTEAALREAVRNLHAKTKAMERMWMHIADRDQEPYEEQADQAEAMALKRIRQLNPYIRTLEDVRDRQIPVHSPVATRGKKKKLMEARNNDQPQPSASGLQGPGWRLGELNRNEGNGETDYESAGEVEFAPSRANGNSRPPSRNGSIDTVDDDDVEFVRIDGPNTDGDVNGRENDGARSDRESVNGRAGAADEAAPPDEGTHREGSNQNRESGREGSLGRPNRPGSLPPAPVNNERVDNEMEGRQSRHSSRGSSRASMRNGNRAEEQAERGEHYRARSRERERGVSRSFSRDRNGHGRRPSRSPTEIANIGHALVLTVGAVPNSRVRDYSRDRRERRREPPEREAPRRRSPGRSSRDRPPRQFQENHYPNQNRGSRDYHGNEQPNHRGRNPPNDREYHDRLQGRRDRNQPNYRDRNQGGVRDRNQPSYRDYSQRSHQNHYNGYQDPFPIRDRAQSWGQQNYYPRQSRNFVPPQNDSRFGDLDFPDSWALPAAADFHRYFTSVDVLPLLGKPNAFGNFNGNIDSYPGWQENFYRVVHVQAVPLIHKVKRLGPSSQPRRKEQAV